MPYRLIPTWSILLGIAGLFVVVASGLAEASPHKTGHQGPRWRRPFVAAWRLVRGLIDMASSRRASESTCYVMVTQEELRERAAFMEQVQLLKHEVTRGNVQPDVLRVRLETVLRDLQALGDGRFNLRVHESAEVEAVTTVARELLARLVATQPASPPATRPTGASKE